MIQQTRLSNGLRIVTEAMPGLKSASVGVWVAAGGRNERVEQNGIAHFLEHMAFKGTTTRSALQIAEVIEDVGGYINAYTSRETTAYYARVLQDDVPLGLEIIGDILTNAVYDPSEIEIERGVILQEIGQSLDTPDDIIFDWLQEAAFPDQAMGRTILGPSERVRQFGRDDLRKFVGEHYGPSQLIVAAAGGVDHDAIVKQAEGLFGGLRDQPGALPAEPARFRGSERREVKGLEQVHFALGIEGPDYRDPAIYAAQIYSVALGGGMSSRLFQEVREKRGLCYSIFAQTGAYADTGMMTIYAGTASEQIEELTHVTIDEMRRATEDLSQAEIDRARAQMKAGMLMGLESASSRTERLARMVQIWDRVPDVDEIVAKIDAVSLSEVKDFATRLLVGSDTALALYGPAERAPSLEDIKERAAA